MNLTVAVAGPSRVGKSLFCINFAEYLGARTLCYIEEGPRGRARGAATPAEARRLMVDPGSYRNGVVRTFAVNLNRPVAIRLALVDTASLKETRPLPRRERARLVLTLQSIQKADVVLYLVDLSGGDPARLEFAGTAGRSLEQYCRSGGKLFRTVVTKEDLLPGSKTYSLCRHLFVWDGNPVLASSVTRAGFAELRRFFLPRTA